MTHRAERASRMVQLDLLTAAGIPGRGEVQGRDRRLSLGEFAGPIRLASKDSRDDPHATMVRCRYADPGHLRGSRMSSAPGRRVRSGRSGGSGISAGFGASLLPYDRRMRWMSRAAIK